MQYLDNNTMKFILKNIFPMASKFIKNIFHALNIKKHAQIDLLKRASNQRVSVWCSFKSKCSIKCEYYIGYFNLFG